LFIDEPASLFLLQLKMSVRRFIVIQGSLGCGCAGGSGQPLRLNNCERKHELKTMFSNKTFSGSDQN